VSLDLSRIEDGQQQIVIDETNTKLPSNLTLFRSAPRIVAFGVHTSVRARVIVEPRTEGRLPMSLRDREIKVTPEAVQVMIWRSYRSSTTKIYTEPMDLTRMTPAAVVRAKLVLPQYMKLDAGQPTEVIVKLESGRVGTEGYSGNSPP